MRNRLTALLAAICATVLLGACSYQDFPLTHPPSWMYPKGCNVMFHGRYLACPHPAPGS